MRMKVLILNSNNPLRASGVVALELMDCLRKDGHEVKMLVNSYGINFPEGIYNIRNYSTFLRGSVQEKVIFNYDRLRLKFGLNVPKSTKYSFYKLNEKKLNYKTSYLLKTAVFKPDVIILLWINNFLNSKNIYELQRQTGAKILWLLYDMAPFTGGCHYAWDCKGYMNLCGNCPALKSSNPCDRSHRNLIYKKKYFDNINLSVIAGSEWQYRQASSSTLFKGKEIFKILIPVNPEVFKPVDKAKLRQTMNIPPEKKVIFFGAIGLQSPRKGMKYLTDALLILKEKIRKNHQYLRDQILLLIAGNDYEPIKNLLPFHTIYLGNLSNDEKLAGAYQAADIFVCPSIEDSGPMMINQSVMCGTPVVSFEMGVSIDLVVTGMTGYRAKLGDSDDMADGIIEILRKDSHEYEKMVDSCRNIAIRYISPEARMDKLRKLLEKSN